MLFDQFEQTSISPSRSNNLLDSSGVRRELALLTPRTNYFPNFARKYPKFGLQTLDSRTRKILTGNEALLRCKALFTEQLFSCLDSVPKLYAKALPWNFLWLAIWFKAVTLQFVSSGPATQR